MSGQNGRAKVASDRRGNFSAETIAYLERRSAAFQHMTAGKGKPQTYGASKREKN